MIILCNVALLQTFLYVCHLLLEHSTVLLAVKDTVLVAQVATVAITKSNSPTVKGQQHAVRCSFSQLQENVAFESLEMNYMLPNNTESGLAVMRSPGFSLFSGYSYFGFVSTDIGHENSVESNYMSLTLPSATCLIVGVRFWCVLSATTHSSLVSIISKEKSDRITLDLVGTSCGLCCLTMWTTFYRKCIDVVSFVEDIHGSSSCETFMVL